MSPGRGKKAVLDPEGKIKSDGTTVLGADDASGIASIIEALTVIRENDLPHPEIEVLFTVGEEIYDAGSSNADYSRIKAKTAYVLDLTGKAGTAAVAAPTLLALDITVLGKASHAGIAPEEGINALSIAANALSQLKTGHISPDTTVNFGTIEGGKGSNVVPGRVHITGEVRSMRHEAAIRAVDDIKGVFTREAERLGGTAEVSFAEKIRAYRISEDEPVIRRLRDAAASLGWGEPTLVDTFGGSDNNQFVKHGIRGVVLASAMELIHTTEEYSEVSELIKSAELTLELMTLA